MSKQKIVQLDQVGIGDVASVGGKNASLGEMISELSTVGIKVPTGFATTASGYDDFLSKNDLKSRIEKALNSIDINDVTALSETGSVIREWILATPLPQELERNIRNAYQELGNGQSIAVAVRSSATAEDLPEASFAGQQESFLNIRGADSVIDAVHKVFASLFNNRAIAYRQHKGFSHNNIALSVGIQKMVRSDTGSSGVMFTLDTESGFRDVVFITASLGLGECVVQGSVNPDEFYVHKSTLRSGRPAILRKNLGEKLIKMIYADDKTECGTQTIETTAEERTRFSITDHQVHQLAEMALKIEDHYCCPMDIEWGLDGVTNELLILQARPETVSSRNNQHILRRYQIQGPRTTITQGRSIGQKIGSGVARIIPSAEQLGQVHDGDILVTDMTDPDWEPVMKRASAIVTNRGGRTCHAAIIARELGVPAVVGCGDATKKITNESEVTVSCAEGDTGHVYKGLIPYEVDEIKVDSMPRISTKITMNVGNPDRAFDFQRLPNTGVGLARLEFIIANMIGIHPKALIDYDKMPSDTREHIDKIIAGYNSPIAFYTEKLAEGIATITAAFSPSPVIVRLSDFKSNEYSNLIGGQYFEPTEENPMLGLRGASRYLDPQFRECFALECKAINHVRKNMGFTNLWIMVPFVRTPIEAKQVTALLSEFELTRGLEGLKIMMMCELPSNVLLAEEFLAYFDGFSIGSNDLTQLTLGLDRDSADIAHLFDERNKAVKYLLEKAIQACRKADKYVGICGQGPSDHLDLAHWLIDQGIESISLNPDTVVETWLSLASPRKN
ncbi:MAG: phosphoenolpyruvate synthase [Acidiferrobacteraceae bacterium]|nr:phosphoenolpyruvate synthase [Acidiferrobacteraceae bacterium]